MKRDRRRPTGMRAQAVPDVGRKIKLTITKRTVDALKPADKPWIAWDDKLTGFGVRNFAEAKTF